MTDSIIRAIGSQVLKYRLRHGLTRYGLAQQVGVTVETIDRWEDGKQVPSAKNFKRLGRVFGVTRATLEGRQNTCV